MDREFSAAMLQKWEDMITENHDLILAQNTYSKDQWALMQLVEDYKVCALPEGQVTFVADLWGRLTTVLTSLGFSGCRLARWLLMISGIMGTTRSGR